MPETIPLTQLLIAAIPALVVVGILFYWQGRYGNALLALVRMLVQLLAVGYVLAAIFQTKTAWIVGIVLLVMMFVASWISLRTFAKDRLKLLGLKLLGLAFAAILLGGGVVLMVIVFGVLAVEPWFEPRTVIPLAGMIFANCMNAVSLAGERFVSECGAGKDPLQSRRIAFEASLIPATNSLLAVGLVSIPGMMTGQVLAGVEPSIAARYQIMVMCMVYGAAGMSAALFLTLVSREGPLHPKEEGP